LQNKYFILTGKRAVSGGVSVERLLEFVDEDCCQAEQLVEFDVAVSFGITPRVFFLF